MGFLQDFTAWLAFVNLFVWFCDQCPVAIILRACVYTDSYNTNIRWLKRKLFNEKNNMFSMVVPYKRN